MAEHIILRDLNAGASVAGPYDRGIPPSGWEFRSPSAFGSPMAGAAAEAAAPDPFIEVADLDEQDVATLARDRSIAAQAPAIPTALVAPVAEGTAEAGDSWGIAAIEAGTTTLTGEGTVVAVLDTGIDSKHPAFAGMKLTEVDFTKTGNDDQRGHGTHCAGTIFGRDVDGQRIGVARGVSHALIGKVLDAQGNGTTTMAFRGMQWAAEQNADVISMSLRFDFPGHVAAQVALGWPVDIATSAALVAYRANLRLFDSYQHLMRARAAIIGGPVVVAAAGNESRTGIRPDFAVAVALPAAAEGVVSVGALQRNGEAFEIAPFSNRLPEVCAPGVGIVSARAGGGLKAENGTSMACPHVAGIAALWCQKLRMTGHLHGIPELVRMQIITSARTDRLSPQSTIADRGKGRVVAPQ